MSYISPGDRIGEGGEITLSEETLIAQMATLTTPLYFLRINAAGTGIEWAATGGSGTVTSVSVVTANGVSGTVATATTTPAITLILKKVKINTIPEIK